MNKREVCCQASCGHDGCGVFVNMIECLCGSECSKKAMRCLSGYVFMDSIMCGC